MLLVIPALVSSGTMGPPGFPRAQALGTAVAGSFSEDWPAYMYGANRSGHAPSVSGISVANASSLEPAWEYSTGAFVSTSPVVSAGRVFVGAWDGYEYALNATTGALLWRTYLNQTTTANCPTTRGVSSTPTVVGDTLYLGGGGAYWYALSASTGSILWNVFVGDNSLRGGHYNWASPLIYAGAAYVGVASDCDEPLVQGGLLEVNLTSHRVVHTFNTSTPTTHGASVWGSPAVDPETNLVYFVTGNGGTYGASLVALNATTLALNGSWQVPSNQSISDGDFGSTPTVFTSASGQRFVGAANKNGWFYAFNDSRVGAGPVWEVPIAVAGECPECGQGSISPATFDGATLFVAGGESLIGGIMYAGSVRALDPGSGALRWQQGAPGMVLGGLASTAGMVIAGTGSTLEILNASSGRPVLAFPAGSSIDSEPTVAEGHLFLTSSAGAVFALAPTSGHWLQLFTPPPVRNASLTYDRSDAYVLQFGGCASDLCPSAETWTWAGSTWTNRTPSLRNDSNTPSPRIDAALAFDASDGYVVLFGGYLPGGADLGDTWTFHAGVWNRLAPATSPSARSGASMAYDPTEGALLLFGGAQHAGTARNDLGDTWKFSQGGWTPVKTPGPSVPPARDSSALAYYPNDSAALLFGGRTSISPLSDTWEFKSGKWKALGPHTHPPAEYGAGLEFANDSGAIVLFGGHGAGSTVLSATWTFSKGVWKNVTASGGPSARMGFDLIEDESTGYSMLYGGMSVTGEPLGDTWKLQTLAWTHLFPVSPGGARYGAGSAYDGADGYLLIFGGHNPTSTFYSTSLEFTGSGYATLCAGCTAGKTEPAPRAYPSMAYDAADGEIILFGGLGPGGPLGDTWSFRGGKWTNLTGGLTAAPSPRWGGGMAFDGSAGSLILFGGRAALGDVNDTWSFVGGTWSQISSATSPSSREGVGMTYDAAAGRVILFGGNDSGGFLGDTWEFDGVGWTRVVTSTAPSPRTYPGLSTLGAAFGSVPVLVGGLDSGGYLSDVWTYQSDGWVPLYRGSSPGVRAAAVTCFDPALQVLLVYGGSTGGAGLLSAAGDSWTFGAVP